MKRTTLCLLSLVMIFCSVSTSSLKAEEDCRSISSIDDVKKLSVYYDEQYEHYDYSSFQQIDKYFKVTKNDRSIQFVGINRHIVVDESSEWAQLGLQDYDEVLSIQIDDDVYNSVRDIERLQNCLNCILSYRKVGSQQVQQLRRKSQQLLGDTSVNSTNGLTTCTEDGACTVRIERFNSSLLQNVNFDKLSNSREVIFDLQNSSGGEIQVLLAFLDRLFNKDELLFVEKRRQKDVSWRSEGLVKFDIMSFDEKGRRTTVLKNSSTASCSEIFIAVLRDKIKNFKMLGERTYGKFKIIDFEIVQNFIVWYTRSIVHFSNGVTYDEIGI